MESGKAPLEEPVIDAERLKVLSRKQPANHYMYMVTTETTMLETTLGKHITSGSTPHVIHITTIADANCRSAQGER